MKRFDVNELLQWIGAVFVVAGHICNAIGPAVYPYNIAVFLIGTTMFLIWCFRVKNKPQMFVNLTSVAIGVTGMIKAFN